jgi:NAD(P)-dependent dehydrogenase (short-subunit alcohol dehydrogenase family)
MPGEFSNKVVVITGASRGIGLGIARGFLAEGSEVAILADDGAVIDTAAALSAEFGRPVRAWRCDITVPADLATVAAELGPLAVLVNNAGLERLTPIEDGDPATDHLFARILEINVTGTWAVTRTLLPHLGPGARIINTASVWGKSAAAGFSAYVASKHAVIGLTKTAAGEVARQGIRVNAVCPGPVDTRMIHSLEAQLNPADPASVSRRYQAAIPLGRYVTTDEIAGTVLFLCSDLASAITGAQYVVDGGRTATGGAVTQAMRD